MSAKILLLDSDADHASAQALALKKRDHAITVALADQTKPTALREQIRHHDIVILNLSRNRSSDWTLLDWISGVVATNPGKPRVLAISSVKRGPGMKLDAEAYKARFVYERSL
jgi:ActR/RegA family two-component response regulator